MFHHLDLDRDRERFGSSVRWGYSVALVDDHLWRWLRDELNRKVYTIYAWVQAIGLIVHEGGVPAWKPQAILAATTSLRRASQSFIVFKKNAYAKAFISGWWHWNWVTFRRFPQGVWWCVAFGWNLDKLFSNSVEHRKPVVWPLVCSDSHPRSLTMAVTV